VSRFTEHLGLNLLEFSDGRAAGRDGRCLWWLDSPLPYEVGEEGSGKFVTVPAFDGANLTDQKIRDIISRRWRPRGVTDLGSIPWFGRWAVAPDDPVVKAFVTHDDGYASLGANWIPAIGRPATRQEVDRELRIAMKALGAGSLKRAVVYNSVKFGGGGAWGT
jgi:hypothetical protein